MEIISHAKLIEEDLADVISLLGDGILNINGKAMCYGDAGSYKTAFMQRLLLCVSEGVGWYGFETPIVAPSLYCELEVGRESFKRRSRAVTRSLGVNGENAHYAMMHTFSLVDPGDRADLIEAALRLKVGIIGLDPVNLIMEGSENDDAAVRELLRGADEVRRETGAAVMLVHHANKGMFHEGVKVDRGFRDLSGTKNLGAWPDLIVRLSRIEGRKHTVEVRFEKLRDGEPPTPIWLTFNPVTLALEADDGDPYNAVIRFLEGGPKPITLIDKMLSERGIAVNKRSGIRQQVIQDGVASETGKKPKIMELVT